MLFLKGLVIPGVFLYVQATEVPANHHIAISIPNVGGNVSNDALIVHYWVLI